MSGRMVLNIFDHMADNIERALTVASDELADMGFEKARLLQKEILQCGGYRNL